jgi:hypothetical protein
LINKDVCRCIDFHPYKLTEIFIAIGAAIIMDAVRLIIQHKHYRYNRICSLPFVVVQKWVCHAIAQAGSHRLPNAAARVRSQIRSCGISGVQSGTTAGFLRVHQPLHIHLVLVLTSSSNKLERCFATAQFEYCWIDIVTEFLPKLLTISQVTLILLYLSILLHYFTYNNTTSVTMQPRKLICIFSFLFSQYVSVLAGHHQVLLFILKLSNYIAYHFYLLLLSTKLRYSLIILIFIKIVLFKIFVLKFHPKNLFSIFKIFSSD